MKKIGITVRFDIKTGLVFVRREYLEYIKNYFDIVLLSIDSSIDQELQECDCFLIPGGDDVNPHYYNDVVESHSEYVIEEVDELDKKVIEYALKTKKPLLGICRGIQCLNVFLGGSLIQNIEGDTHKKNLNGDLLEPSSASRLFPNIFKSAFFINSYHHQAIDRLAPDLICLGKSKGLIEAVEHKNAPIFAVQWHPEKLHDETSKMIIEGFRDIVYESR